MSEFIGFMNGPIGRSARVLLGLALIALGVWVGGVVGIVVAAVGVIPIALGVSGRCILEFLARGAGTGSQQAGKL